MHETTELCLCDVANVPDNGFFGALDWLMFQKNHRLEYKPRRKDIIRRFMHNSLDARSDC